MTDERSWPSLGEELARKALETLHEAAHKNSTGELSDQELVLVVNTITDLTMGLIPKEISNLIYQVRKEL
jgi:hypothetical protein